MDNLRTTDSSRSALSFSVEGLSSRDEILFKSLVRVLDHLTIQKWIYRSPSADDRVDLLVVAEWVQPTAYKFAHPVQQPVLTIGKGPDRDRYLPWPVQPQRLQAELNRIGNMAVLHQPGNAAAISALMPGSFASDRAQLFRLNQWPPVKYLTGIGRMRLATLLTGKAMTLEELHQRSALSLPICQAFIADLQKSRLLVQTTVAVSVPMRTPEPHELLNLTSSALAFAKPGLLDRIRAGLGIKTSKTSKN